MVTIEFSGGNQRDYLNYDETFAVELFKAGCANIAEAEDVGDEIVTEECARLAGAAP